MANGLVDLAFAEKALQTREVPGADFRLAKCITLDFFGAGIVDIPAKGYKKTKNSRRVHMVFFVHLGKVEVEVADCRFSITKGGVWQVPRGKVFSFPGETSLTRKNFSSPLQRQHSNSVIRKLVQH